MVLEEKYFVKDYQTLQKNVKNLLDYGYSFIGPTNGKMACGEYGEGKMSDPLSIFNEIKDYLNNQIKIKKIAPLGDPIDIEVRGYELCLRKFDMSMIDVEVIS